MREPKHPLLDRQSSSRRNGSCPEIAETKEQARIRRSIEVDYEELPVVVDAIEGSGRSSDGSMTSCLTTELLTGSWVTRQQQIRVLPKLTTLPR